MGIPYLCGCGVLIADWGGGQKMSYKSYYVTHTIESDRRYLR